LDGKWRDGARGDGGAGGDGGDLRLAVAAACDQLVRRAHDPLARLRAPRLGALGGTVRHPQRSEPQFIPLRESGVDSVA
jgi:hypothetical protein